VSEGISDRWALIERLCADAMSMSPESRAEYLRMATRDDEPLRREVDELIACGDAAGAFLERPALYELAAVVADDVTALTGREIGGYRIDAFLGAGGMGDVYRARDLKLDRDIALKVIQQNTAMGPDDMRRVEREARAASSLNHPGIVTIYSVGETDDIAFIAMELVRGRTLRELGSAEAPGPEMVIDIAVQLAGALSAAHAAGIVHRDLKPENVMVTPSGLVKVLDFGIAKRQRAVDEESVILGTAAYMSPEQAEGAPADHRADQFSFGGILYELLSGRRAFARETNRQTLAAVIAESPPSLAPSDNPAINALHAIVGRCLSKSPASRYESSDDLVRDLRAVQRRFQSERRGRISRRQVLWLGAAGVAVATGGLQLWRRILAAPTVRRLAVLPFANPAKDEGTQYLCEGVAGSLIRRLSGVSGVQVKALSAVMHLPQELDPRGAGRQLEADAVLAGSIVRRGGRLVVSAELVDVSGATRLWGETFDRPQTDVLAVEDAIAGAILRDGFGMTDASVNGSHAGPTKNPVAYDLYLQALHYFRLEDEADYLIARDLLLQALSRDSAFALAYVTLASTYSVMAIDGYERPTVAWTQSAEYLNRALGLDPGLPDAHAEASAAAFYYKWDWAAAAREWDMALNSRRGEDQSELFVLRAMQEWAFGRGADALKFARAARQADPLSPLVKLWEADLLARTGQLDAAAALYTTIIRDAPDDVRAYFGLAEVRSAQGRFDDAIEARLGASSAAGEERRPDPLLHGADGYARLQRNDLQRQLDALRRRESSGGYVSPLDYASVYARQGDTEKAFEFLNTAFEHHASGLVFLRVDPSWDNLRADPRFPAAIRRVGLPPPQ
jgi:TolB-like protein